VNWPMSASDCPPCIIEESLLFVDNNKWCDYNTVAHVQPHLRDG